MSPRVDVVMVAYNSAAHSARLRRAARGDRVGRGHRGRQRVAGRLAGHHRRPAGAHRQGRPQRRLRRRLQPRHRPGRTRRTCCSSTRTRVSSARAWRRSWRCSTREPRAGLAAPRILEDDGELAYSQRRFPRLRSTFAQALFLHRLWPRADWTDELIRDRAAYELPGLAGLGVRRLHADPARGARAARRAGRGLLPLLRGHRPLRAPARRRLVDPRTSPRPRSATRAAPRAPARSCSRSTRATASSTRASTRAAGRCCSRAMGVALGHATHALVAVARPPARRGHLHALRRSCDRSRGGG